MTEFPSLSGTVQQPVSPFEPPDGSGLTDGAVAMTVCLRPAPRLEREGPGQPAEPFDQALRSAAASYQEYRLRHTADDHRAIDMWASALPAERQGAAGLIRDVHCSDPLAARRLAEAVTAMPSAGETFLGFRLEEELGRGAFGRVFLARQGDLADRPVVLKVAADLHGESQTLALLQHTNIVPIYSAHRSSPFHALCMPFFGSVTLSDIYRELEGMPSLPDSGRGLLTTLSACKTFTLRRANPAAPSSVADPGQAAPADAPAAPAAPGASEDAVATLKMLEGLSYVEAVLWLGARLADGLAHAHQRGVVHRDLKPANVLLTDDGQPMLLDFNLSDDLRLRGGPAAAGVGGTLPYMSPEQLEAFFGRGARVDPRSDIYSLGIILYELLTRRHPFPSHRRVSKEVLEVMLRDRRRPPPRLQGWNPAVSPAVESIVRHCLEPNPDRRYQSALALKEDLELHLADRPLRHAPEPSLGERLRKWRRRHPYLASTAAMGVAAVAVLGALVTAYLYHDRRLARLQAVDGLDRTGAAVHAAQALLFDRGASPEQRGEGVQLCRDIVDRYQVLRDPAWRESALVRPLSADERARLSEQVGDLLFLLANVTRQQARAPAGERADDQLRQALEMNSAGLACYDTHGPPRGAWQQRAELARLLGDAAEERRALQQLGETPARAEKDAFLSAYLDYTDGRYRKALPLLRRATQEDPRSFAAWFARGICHFELLQDAEAVACFNSCVALRPEFVWSWYNRGLAQRRLRNYEPALADFDRAVGLQPQLVKGYVNRALARSGLKDHAGAVRDLTKALELAEQAGAPSTSILFLRAAARRRADDLAGAGKDYEEGLRRQPADEDGFVERGLARVADQPGAALEDFDAALALNPRSFNGLQNKAALLVDKFGRDGEALRVMDQAVSLYPDSVLARGGRGVLLARVGKRAQALEDAQESLLLDSGPAALYQAACVFALTSRQQEEDRVKALQLLSAALRQGYGLDLIDDDKDLDPVRNLPEYRRLAEAARALHARAR
jgi:serine/threonine protein kinase/predicted Zn-dependent protease